MSKSEILSVAKEICDQLDKPGIQCDFWDLIHRLKYVIETDELQEPEIALPRLASDVVKDILNPPISRAVCPRSGCTYNGFKVLDRYLCTHPTCPIKGTPGNRMKSAHSEGIPSEGAKPGFPDQETQK